MLIAMRIKAQMRKFVKYCVLSMLVVLFGVAFCSCGECKHEQTDTKIENEIFQTCTSDGSYDEVVYCTECDAELSITKKTLFAEGHSELSHGPKVPTCTEHGWAAYVTCENCSYTTYEEIPPSHSIIEHQAKAATCTAVGWYAYQTCENCSYTTYNEIPKTEHREIPHGAKTPTCTEIGWAAYVTCEGCDYSTYEEIGALGHSEIPHLAKAPSCTEHGWEAYVSCENCSYTTYSEIEAGHTYEDGVCIRCDELKPSEGLYFRLSSNGTYYNVSIGTCTDEYVVIPKTYRNLPVKKIDSGAFWGSGVVSVVIPEGVEAIQESAFYECKSLVSVIIPSSVTSIEHNAFYRCYRLVEVVNRSSINMTVGSNDHGGVAYYAGVIHSGASMIVNLDGCLFISFGGINYLVSYVGSDSEIILPDSFMGENYAINGYAFMNLDTVTDNTMIGISDKVTAIGVCAFSGCRNITTVIIPDTVTFIGTSAFSICKNLKYFDFGDGITVVPENMFVNCSSLESVVMPRNIHPKRFLTPECSPAFLLPPPLLPPWMMI